MLEWMPDSRSSQGAYLGPTLRIWTEGMRLTDATFFFPMGLEPSADLTHQEIRYPDGTKETCSLVDARNRPDKDPKILPGTTIWVPMLSAKSPFRKHANCVPDYDSATVSLAPPGLSLQRGIVAARP
jgi:hypothetical protein